jgi:hypothetical protein
MLTRLLKTQPHLIDVESTDNSTGSVVQKACRHIELALREVIDGNSAIF